MPVFLPGESHGQRSLVGYSPWGNLACTHDIHLVLSRMSCRHTLTYCWSMHNMIHLWKSIWYCILVDVDILKPRNSTCRCIWKSKKFMCIPRNIYRNDHLNIIQNNQKNNYSLWIACMMSVWYNHTMQQLTAKEMNKESLGLGHLTNWTTEQKSQKREYIMHEDIYIKFKSRQN